jgi:hypothetical protein
LRSAGRMTHTLTAAEVRVLANALPTRSAIAFSAACAERLIPFLRDAGVDESLVEAALDHAWSLAAGEGERVAALSEAARLVTSAERLASEDRPEPWFAADVMLCVAQAIRCAEDGRLAASAARRAQEALGAWFESASHPLVSTNLEGQSHDLRQLIGGSAPDVPTVADMRARARRFAAGW